MKKELTIFDNPKNVKRLQTGFFLALIVLLIAESFVEMHGYFSVEHFYGFYAVYGFISYVLLIFLAKLLRKIIMRKEDYYDQ
ncbi:MAG: hypothetical protein KKE62_06635 [Proteobacteria bacterium]|nr:hypothetical protein [Pseudomonadota bacterium]MBU1386604.1 hypothetical protein [Pseudomonadota bacterium]MBU1542505.1 hypothetical protein [Pseudomonadota bacterium]MBU2431269.1 hypothetical protein [Pseudomonadota bacterium]MBU2481535.1 hypothetical protein [Pseudomonadota bacterium]